MKEKEVLWPGWETVRLIGCGSFGAVYEIERDVFGHKEKAAIKVIAVPQRDSDIEELYDSGYDEAGVTAAFKSHLESIVNEYSLMREMNGAASVVNCDDFRIVPHDNGIGWDIFIKMELLTPLTKALDKQTDDVQVIQIAKDMCSALILCKKYGIIHRDIKPQNIFVSKNGDYKLGDFGIAKTIEKTSGGTKVGTYKYMAPEVYNNQPYNLTADIYSLGLVLHWMLNERRSPFMPLPPAPAVATQENAAMAKRFIGTPIPAPAHGSHGLKCIVLKACSFDPKDRYQSAEEMLRDLEALSGASGRTDPAGKEMLYRDARAKASMADKDRTVSIPHQNSVPVEASTVRIINREVYTGETATACSNTENKKTGYEYKTAGAFSTSKSPKPPIDAPTKPKKRKTGVLFGALAAVALAVLLVIVIQTNKKDVGNPMSHPTVYNTPEPTITESDNPELTDDPDMPSGEARSLEVFKPIFGGDASIWEKVNTSFNRYVNVLPQLNLDVAASKYPGWFGTIYIGSKQNASHADGVYTLALQGPLAVGDYQITHEKIDNSNNNVLEVADITLHVDSSGCSISDVTFSRAGYQGAYSEIWDNYDVWVEQVGSEILLHYRMDDNTFFDYDNYPELTKDHFYCKGHLDFVYDESEDGYHFKVFNPIPAEGIVWECREYTFQDIENPFSAVTVLCK